MKGFFLFFTFIIVALSAVSQYESVGPLAVNSDLLSSDQISQQKSLNTFDSSFIYRLDTLTLPFFDEFSKNHFQQYTADFSNPTVTFDKKFRILDGLTNIPIASSEVFSSQVTFKRTYNVATDTYTDVNFVPVNHKLGDLSSYPVVYTTTPMFPAYFIYDTIGGLGTDMSDTIFVTNPDYFQDSATQFFMDINDPSAYWIDHAAYHN